MDNMNINVYSFKFSKYIMQAGMKKEGSWL